MERTMEVVKKNLVSIICGVVALVAILAVFWPISGMFEDLQSRASGRVSVYNQLREMIGKERRLPAVTLQEGATGDRLDQFPTPAVIAAGTKVKDDFAAEAKSVFDAAVKLNQGDKKPLVPEALPEPPGNRRVPTINRFQQEYVKEMDYASGDPARRAQSMPAREMKAGMRPSDGEIKAEQDRLTKLITRDEMQYGPNGKPTNEPQVKAKIALETAEVGARKRQEVAQNSKVYVDPGSLEAVERVGGPGPQPPPYMIFWAQMGLWLQQDICRAINEANGGAKNVLDSAVKRVVKIDLPDLALNVPHGFTMPVTVTTPGADAIDPSVMTPPAADPSQPIVKNFAVSPTGRYSNPLYDVIQFKMTLIVDAARIPIVLQALSRNRFITVYETNITVVDSGKEQANGYIYGPQPVVQLDMDCEALFMREWTKQYMPRVVRNALQIVDQPATPPQ